MSEQRRVEVFVEFAPSENGSCQRQDEYGRTIAGDAGGECCWVRTARLRTSSSSSGLAGYRSIGSRGEGEQNDGVIQS